MHPHRNLRTGSYERIAFQENDIFIIKYDKYVLDPTGTCMSDSKQYPYNRLFNKSYIYKSNKLEGLLECIEHIMKNKDISDKILLPFY